MNLPGTIDGMFSLIHAGGMFVIGLGREHGGDYACYVGDETDRILSGWTKGRTPLQALQRAYQRAAAARPKLSDLPPAQGDVFS